MRRLLITIERYFDNRFLLRELLNSIDEQLSIYQPINQLEYE